MSVVEGGVSVDVYPLALDSLAVCRDQGLELSVIVADSVGLSCPMLQLGVLTRQTHISVQSRV